LREKLKQRCYEQAKQFSWDISARQILKVYQTVAGGEAVPSGEKSELLGKAAPG